jgi:hypothetical protein
MKVQTEKQKAEKEIMDILGEHISPDWTKVGDLVRIAKW